MSKKLTDAEVKIIQGVINARSRHWVGVGPQELEDMQSMAWVTVLERMVRFDEKRCKLRTYVDHCVQSAFMDWYRKYYKPRGSKDEDRDHTRAVFNQHIASINRGSDSNIDDMVLINQLSSQLSEKDQHIVGLYISGLTLKDIGRALKVTESRVSQLMGGIIERMRQYDTNTPAENSQG
jgi:RNA polymerase sigma factor (sigma-70 family)